MRRGPSSSSTIASTYGGFTLKALLSGWYEISKEKRRPRPLDWIQPMRRDAQRGQRMRG